MQRQAAVSSMGSSLAGRMPLDCASKINFAGHIAGTVEPSLDHHASRQLSDKVLRYLKRVIVTPPCLLVLRQVETRFKIQALSRIRDYTQPFDLAVPYVFIKQSGPCHDQLFPIWHPSPEVTVFAEFPTIFVSDTP